jgi:hypothetical protein
VKVIRFFTGTLFILQAAFSANYPDQQYTLTMAEISSAIETFSNMKISDDGKYLELVDGVTYGYVDLKPDSSEQPFNRGLPSWNGEVTDDNTSFLIQMRFPESSGWSDWLTVGYWKNFVWATYGKTSFSGGYVDIDYVKLSTYVSKWQFRINMIRKNVSEASPILHKLSFFVSDTRTTSSADFTAILNDKPAEIFIPTEFVYQYGVDDEIGGSICSPSTVSMILRSYDIEVDPYDFALDTYDPYHKIFGCWPRVVQNASEKGLDGAVTRYRTWSETREVLEKGGRIAMSLGSPMYPSGHLVMLAGFTSDGRPIVHNPARSSGYSIIHDKSDLSHSWFDKGGIAYTFYLPDSQTTAIADNFITTNQPDEFELFQNYPNPFNSTTKISFNLAENSPVKISVYNSNGGLVEVLYEQNTPAGFHEINWNAGELASGTYFISLSNGKTLQVIKTVLMK